MRECFGTYEFCRTSFICKNCEDFKECKKEAPKRSPIRSSTETRRRKKMERLRKKGKLNQNVKNKKGN